MENILQTTMEINGLEFNIHQAGAQNNGDLVILLHGFPESSIMWEKTIQKLSNLGYYVIAPDQRGYSLNARPENFSEYSMDILADDIIEIANQLGYSQFHLVGHDIGAVVGWSIVSKYPQKIKSWTALSVPNWPAYVWALKNDPTQQEKGAYVKRFQDPEASEKLISSNDFAILRNLWSGFNSNTIDQYLNIFSRPGALTSIIKWYKALFSAPTSIDYTSIKPNTILIYGNSDLAIGESGIEKNAEYMTGNYKLITLNAGHWLMEFNTDEVNNIIIDNLSGTIFEK